MGFLQQQQPQSDGFQNLLGILRSNRERDAQDLASFHSGNPAEAAGARKRLISHGVIDEGDTLDGMQSKIAADVQEASKTKAEENPNAGKDFGNGYIASKMGQKGYNEQQTFANAGADSFNQRMMNKAGLKFGDDGKAYQWDETAKKYNAISDKAAQDIVNANQTYALDPEGKKGVDALRYAAQQKADATTEAARTTPMLTIGDLRAARKANPNFDNEIDDANSTSAQQAKKNAADAAKDGEGLNLPAIDRSRLAKKDDADAVKVATDQIRAKGGDIDQIFKAAGNESGNAQYNYARGKQYIEDMMPAGPARDAAIARYQEMFMQQQLVGKDGAYMGDIYGKKNGGGGGGGRVGGIATVGGGVSNKSLKFNYSGYATPETMNAKAPDEFLNQWAITFYGGDKSRISAKMKKYRDPSMWDAEDQKRYYSFDTKPLQEGLNLPAYDADKYEQLVARGVKPAEARAMAEIPRGRAQVSKEADDELGSGKKD